MLIEFVGLAAILGIAFAVWQFRRAQNPDQPTSDSDVPYLEGFDLADSSHSFSGDSGAHDCGGDAGGDAGCDAGSDAGCDAGSDAGCDAGGGGDS
jgi:hypothetical protein